MLHFLWYLITLPVGTEFWVFSGRDKIDPPGNRTAIGLFSGRFGAKVGAKRFRGSMHCDIARRSTHRRSPFGREATTHPHLSWIRRTPPATRGARISAKVVEGLRRRRIQAAQQTGSTTDKRLGCRRPSATGERDSRGGSKMEERISHSGGDGAMERSNIVDRTYVDG